MKIRDNCIIRFKYQDEEFRGIVRMEDDVTGGYCVETQINGENKILRDGEITFIEVTCY